MIVTHRIVVMNLHLPSTSNAFVRVISPNKLSLNVKECGKKSHGHYLYGLIFSNFMNLVIGLLYFTPMQRKNTGVIPGAFLNSISSILYGTHLVCRHAHTCAHQSNPFELEEGLLAMFQCGSYHSMLTQMRSKEQEFHS
jgi:hypothetical protein